MKSLVKCLPPAELRAYHRARTLRGWERRRLRLEAERKRELAAKHERMAKQFVMEHA